MTPDVFSQVNRTCPPGQTDTIPNGDSVMDVPRMVKNFVCNVKGKITEDKNDLK